MPTTTRKGAASAKAAVRADQLRPLNLPRPVEVELSEAGLPAFVTYPYVSSPPHACDLPVEEEQSEIAGIDADGKPVESIIETWNVDDEWWRDPISRRYVEVILRGGKHVILYEDLITNHWFMQKP